MSILLVDTDVVSFIFKQDTRAKDYAALLQGNQLALSFMTVAELFQWSAIRKWGEPRIKQIAATALLYNLPLVTHNVRDFSRISGLEVRTSP